MLFIPFPVVKFFCRPYLKSILRSLELRVKMVSFGGLINTSGLYYQENTLRLSYF